MNDSTNRTKLIAPSYERQLIEAGMPAQCSDARNLANAIARWDCETIPFNLVQQRLHTTYRKYLAAASLDRSQTAAFAYPA